MYYSGINSSALEHRVPEQLFTSVDASVEGISAVKALQIANDSGIPIYTITKNNIDVVLPILQIDPSVINDIRSAVNAGKKVIVSKTNINYRGWVGCGYVIIEPSTGIGGYMISGGMSGAHILCEGIQYFITKVVGIGVTVPEDYCGSKESEWVPDFPFGIDAQMACYNHDICYKNAPTSIDKLHCDVLLGCDLFLDCIYQGNEPFLCGSLANTYSSFVIIFGWQAWRQS
ncbi:MAG: hypothetical protein WA126_12245 [Thermodesulfovibrionales bacterium]